MSLIRNTFRAMAAACVLGAAVSCSHQEGDNKLVILHTNDTHSQIEPGSDGLGGVMRRMAVIDSIRKADKNVMLVDAGDAVQGTLYFYLYGGKVEMEMMNLMGVDLTIMGNHDFDNGIDSLAKILPYSHATKLATNYELDDTPLAGTFEPYAIREFGGKRIGFIGINLNPAGIISEGNYDGLGFLPIVATANLTAEKLRKEDGVDAVVAISHIGYNPAGLVGDSVLAANSRGIDVIIGGHSHDTIDPDTPEGYRRSHMKNLDGRPVLVVQTGKSGRRLGKIEIDLDSLGTEAYPQYELIKIDGRYDKYTNPEIAGTIASYKQGVDSLMQDWIGYTDRTLDNTGNELINFFTDWVLLRGKEIAPDVDLAIANKGGLRTVIPAGKFSKGHIINLLPFRNNVVVLDVKGSDLREVFDVMALTDGNGVSSNVAVKYSKNGDHDARAEEILIGGKPLDDNRTYRVATIDYLAKGGDYMSGLTRGKTVGTSGTVIFEDLINYFTEGEGRNRQVGGDSIPRWTLIPSKR